jgi:hypothetical protein
MKTEILFNRLKAISVSTSGLAETTKLHKLIKLNYLSEFAQLGFFFENDHLFNDSALENFSEVIALATKMRGGDIEYAPLFSGFPNQVPDQDVYMLQRLLSVLMAIPVLDPETHGRVYCVPNLFDPSVFGADPVFQMQNKELFDNAVAEQKARGLDSVHKWVELEFIPENLVDEILQNWVYSCIYAKSSIQENWQADIAWLLAYFPTIGKPMQFDNSRIVHRENKTFLTKHFWENCLYSQAIHLMSSATDCLRLFAALTGSDISLAEKIKFPKLSRAQRKIILSVLERKEAQTIAEELNIYKDLWLELGRYIHPTEYRRQYPKTAEAFNLLRNGKVETFNGKVQSLLKNGHYLLASALLAKKPGLFARHIVDLMRKATEEEGQLIAGLFGTVADQVPVKTLMTIHSYVMGLKASEKTAVIIKNGKIQVLDRPSVLPFSKRDNLMEALDKGLTQLSDKETWEDKSIYFDERLRKYVLPLSERKLSDSMLPMARGTRVKVKGPVVRLFAYWKEEGERTDLDLSILMLDDKFNALSHVSYTNLREGKVVHSGDVQSAPYGAVEFIDIPLSYDCSKLLPSYVKKESKVRYVAVEIHRYAGHKFSEMPQAFTGWMEREEVNNDRASFDPKTVANKLQLTGGAQYSIPIIFDLLTQEMIYTDLYVSGNKAGFNRVEDAADNVCLIAEQIARFVEVKPTFYDLLSINITHRGGTLVDDIEDADIVFGVSPSADYGPFQVGRVLSELL